MTSASPAPIDACAMVVFPMLLTIAPMLLKNAFRIVRLFATSHCAIPRRFSIQSIASKRNYAAVMIPAAMGTICFFNLPFLLNVVTVIFLLFIMVESFLLQYIYDIKISHTSGSVYRISLNISDIKSNMFRNIHFITQNKISFRLSRSINLYSTSNNKFMKSLLFFIYFISIYKWPIQN